MKRPRKKTPERRRAGVPKKTVRKECAHGMREARERGRRMLICSSSHERCGNNRLPVPSEATWRAISKLPDLNSCRRLNHCSTGNMVLIENVLTVNAVFISVGRPTYAWKCLSVSVILAYCRKSAPPLDFARPMWRL